MISDDEYARYAYELGFSHGLLGYERPIKGQADTFYIYGYKAAKL